MNWDFSKAPITFLIPWPFLVLMIIGALFILGAAGAFWWWVFSHLQWVW